MKKKFLKITVMLIMLALVYNSFVNAASFTPTMTPSSTAVAEATEFTITVKITNLDVGTTGINSFNAKLTYDTAVFETLNASSVDGMNAWAAEYKPETGTVMLTKLQHVTSEEDIFQITLKTKSGVNGKTGTVKLTEVTASGPTGEISAQDVSTSIAVGTVANQPGNNNNGGSTQNNNNGGSTQNNNNSGSTQNNNNGGSTQNNAPLNIKADTGSNKNTNTNTNANTNTSTNTNTNTNKNTNTNTNANTNTNKNTNTNTNSASQTDDDIPYTGAEDTIIQLLFVVIAVALIFYIKYEKINKDMK